MKIHILLAAFLVSCLTSCASYNDAITQSEVNRIRPGVTTETDLRQLFGPADTRLASYQGQVSLAWFRSLGPPPAAYTPLVGQFLGGLDTHVQQLSVHLSGSGRVTSYTVYDSNEIVKREKVQTLRETAYSK